MKYANTELERRVLAYLVRVNPLIQVTKDDFTSSEAMLIYELALGGASPNLELFLEVLRNELTIRNIQNPENYEMFLKSLWIEDVDIGEEDIEILVRQLRNFTQARALQSVYMESIRYFQNGEVERAKECLVRGLVYIEEISYKSKERGDFIETFAERFGKYIERKKGREISRINIGIKALDDAVGGIAPCSLNLIQGESSVGKTFFLQEVAFRSFINRRAVLFITVEMKRTEIETRWDGRLAGVPYKKIAEGALTHEEEAWWKKRMKDMQGVYEQGGRLGISFIPEGCTILAVKNELDYWKRKWNGRNIDILVIDYADLLQSDRKVFSEQEQQGVVFRDLKRLCQTENLALWTATQVSGKSYGKLRLDLSDTGYSMRKANWANLVLGLTMTEDDENILRVYVAKNTFGRRFREILLVTDYDRAMIMGDDEGVDN